MTLASKREMSETMPIVIMMIVVAIFVGILGFAYERQKSDERRQWAENRGFDFTESDRDLGRRTGRLFRICGATARDVLRIPTRAGEALYYELVWTESYGDDRWTEACAILRYPLPGPLPLMRIKPEGIFGLANNDLTTEWQEFNREFDVKTDDERVGQAVLTKPVQEFFMDRLRGERLAFDGDGVFLWIDRYDVEDADRCVKLMEELTALIPAAAYE